MTAGLEMPCAFFACADMGHNTAGTSSAVVAIRHLQCRDVDCRHCYPACVGGYAITEHLFSPYRTHVLHVPTSPLQSRCACFAWIAIQRSNLGGLHFGDALLQCGALSSPLILHGDGVLAPWGTGVTLRHRPAPRAYAQCMVLWMLVGGLLLTSRATWVLARSLR